MPWTSHGYWTGLREPDHPGPPRLNCGGPHRCTQCAIEAHRTEAEIAMTATGYGFDDPMHFTIHVTTDGVMPTGIDVHLSGSAVNSDSLTQSIALGVAAAISGARARDTAAS